MTVEELNNEFDIHYNSIAGQSSPNLDLYEKSIFFTKAQLELVKDYYDPQSNRKQKGFEASEKRRTDLKELIKNYKSLIYFSDNNAIDSSSKFFNIPNDVFIITNEKGIIKDTGCFEGKSLNIKPMTQDEYNIQIDNPFKRPNEKVAWRLDFSKINNNKVVEIVTPYKIEYNLRYIKYPKPIILGDLDILFPSENLSIDGQTSPSTCELDIEIHKEIVDRAVALALRDYKPSGLETKLLMNNNNE